jgi:hypothetical protein
MRDRQRLARILFHHQDAGAGGIDGDDAFEDLAGKQRRQAGGRLVE